MPTTAELFGRALRAQQAGHLRQAEPLYREIVRTDPNHAGAHHQLGLIALQTGHLQAAVELIRRAIAVNPSVALYHSNLGLVYHALGRTDEAVASFERALEFDPGFSDALSNLGTMLCQQGRPDDAIPHHQHAVRLSPAEPAAHNNLGIALAQSGRREEAIACFREALRLNPRYADALNNLGLALQESDRSEEAVAVLRQAVALDPGHALAHNNLGAALAELSQREEAIECYRRALLLNPRQSKAQFNLANTLGRVGSWEEAIACYRRALELKPNCDKRHTGLAEALHHLGRFDEAEKHYDLALRINPDEQTAVWNLALLRLGKGDFLGGWPGYERRFFQPEFKERTFDRPSWDGSPLQGRTLLLYAEQGLGDTIQFIRYATFAKERGGAVVFECQRSLVPLLQGVAGVDRLVACGEELPSFDVQAALLSLPGLFGTTVETIPAPVPYLHVDPRRIERWRQELKSPAGFRVGIAWQGNPTFTSDRWRSIPLTHFEPLAKMKGVSLVSLQKNAGSEQLKALAGKFPVQELSDRRDLVDTAAVMKNMDLIVTSDTAVAHLAGAVGVPVWTVLYFAPDWRWLLNREDCPWYPTMRLFRQSRPGDWSEVFERIAAALRQLIAVRGER